MVLYRLLWCCYAVSTVWCCIGYSGVAVQLALYGVVGYYCGVAMQLVLYGVVSVTQVLLCS